VEVSEIDGLERWGSFAPGKALLVRRYDREERPGLVVRIHQEDFAQVLDVHGAGDEKYEHATFQKIAGLVGLISPEDGVEFIRRLVFMILSGNGDMHLKNWSLYYPDRIRPRLSPAYDLLSTLVYPGTSRKMAFKLGRTKEFKEILPHSFEPLAPKLNLPLSTVQDVVATTREQSRRVWSEIQGELPMASPQKAWLSAWLGGLPLLRA
jgi:serine/threonine-protein kinase HipA